MNEININDNVKEPLLESSKSDFSVHNINSNKSTLNPTQEKDYLVYINTDQKDLNNESNQIITSKYTWYNVFPKVLIEQFSKMSNVYFLIIAIMQSIHEISISGGKPAILLPISIIVAINGIKDFFEDWKRKKSDDEENNQICKILNKETRKFEDKKWSDVKLGNIIKIEENKPFPADMILINTSDKHGVCYVETKNLDGETTLKYKNANSEIVKQIPNELDLCYLEGLVQCKQPNEFIYEFDAKMFIDNNESNYIHIDKNSFLLRGCSLKQTEYVFGLVIYVGHNTKIMKNSPCIRFKTSRVEDTMNTQIIWIFIVQFSLSLAATIFNIVSINSYQKIADDNNYLGIDFNNYNYFLIFISRMGTWILIFTNFVPISLLVTLEMVKYIQGMFIQWDVHIYNKERDLPARVQTSTLNEELGQVKYVFSDKTGTLTKNYMEFKKMAIGKEIYGHKQNVLSIEEIKERNRNISIKYSNEEKRKEITNVNFIDYNNQFHKDMLDASDDHKEFVHLFLLCISLCHTVIIDIKEENKGKINYQCSSPDEKALVNAARLFGYVFKSRTIENDIVIEINNKDCKFKFLNLLEYTSERKRMSVIVKNSEGKIFLFAKGADSEITKRITKNVELIEVNESQMLTFAKEGLRTLQIAYKEIDEEEYLKWNEKYRSIISNPHLKESNLENIQNEIENDLFLLGSTAIEDRLQDDIDKTLDFLMQAGIKIWMLTGDKLDTAKSIAFSCKLLTHEFKILEMREKVDKKEIKRKLKEFSNEIIQNSIIKYGMIISTNELTAIMSDETMTNLFLNISIRCNAVICCRVTPKQKAQMVLLIKETQNDTTTLAIGDGANDVNMITSAHIGVGIIGVEGREAARASDYAIAEFSYLRRLLFVHGRESYRKNTYIVCYNFHKNCLFVMPQFWFGFISFFSGQTMYDPWIYQLFNIVFASLPIIWFGIYDREFPNNDTLFNSPQLYVQGVVNKLFHSFRFWKWVLFGIIQGLFVFFLGYYGMISGNDDGRLQDLWSVGSLCLASIVIIVNLKIFFSTNNYDFISTTLIFLSIIAYWIVLLIMSYYYLFENFDDMQILNSYSDYYFTLLLIVVLVLATDIGLGKLMIYFSIVKNPMKISVEEENQILRNKPIDLEEENIKNTYLGGAFSQEQEQGVYIRRMTGDLK